MVYHFIINYVARTTTVIGELPVKDGIVVYDRFIFRVQPGKVSSKYITRGEVLVFSCSRNQLDQELYKIRDYLSNSSRID